VQEVVLVQQQLDELVDDDVPSRKSTPKKSSRDLGRRRHLHLPGNHAGRLGRVWQYERRYGERGIVSVDVVDPYILLLLTDGFVRLLMGDEEDMELTVIDPELDYLDGIAAHDMWSGIFVFMAGMQRQEERTLDPSRRRRNEARLKYTRA
jgi:hypothetical protein